MTDVPALEFWFQYNPVKINAGVGMLDKLDQLVSRGRVLLLSSPGFTIRGQTGRIEKVLGANRVAAYDQVMPNPDLDHLDDLTCKFMDTGIENIVALGGGSVLDTAKVLSVTLPSKIERPLEKMFRHGYAHKWKLRIPVIGIPTTSGTGAEVTPFATIWDTTNKKKFSLADDKLFPKYAVLDPHLTLTLPQKETLYSGLDTISHALESIWNRKRTPVSQALAMQSLDYANTSLVNLFEEPENLGARTKMQQASTLAGLAISQTRTAIAHSISYPLTTHFNIPHGLACGFTLLAILRFLDKQGLLREFSIILESTQRMLSGFDLENEILRYTNYDELFGLATEMYTPDRADNFIIGVNKRDIISFLKGSFRCHS